MLQCCGQAGQVIPILTNPLVWVIALAAVTAVVSKKKEKK